MDNGDMSTLKGWEKYAMWLHRQLTLSQEKNYQFGVRIRELEMELKRLRGDA